MSLVGSQGGRPTKPLSAFLSLSSLQRGVPPTLSLPRCCFHAPPHRRPAALAFLPLWRHWTSLGGGMARRPHHEQRVGLPPSMTRAFTVSSLSSEVPVPLLLELDPQWIFTFLFHSSWLQWEGNREQMKYKSDSEPWTFWQRIWILIEAPYPVLFSKILVKDCKQE